MRVVRVASVQSALAPLYLLDLSAPGNMAFVCHVDSTSSMVTLVNVLHKACTTPASRTKTPAQPSYSGDPAPSVQVAAEKMALRFRTGGQQVARGRAARRRKFRHANGLRFWPTRINPR
jgi:hypothetical protein